MQGQKYLPVISGLFTATLLLSNILDVKIFSFFEINLPAGIILFPLAYVFGDILTEVYGFIQARKIIWTGFISLILMTLAIEIAKNLPEAEFWEFQSEFLIVFAKVPRIAIASIIAYFLGEFVNSVVLSKLKATSKRDNLAKRFIFSTLAGQGIDTIVFVLIAYAGYIDAFSLINIILSGWTFKVLWEIIALPITIPVVKFIKRMEGFDHVDRGIKYTIF